jgi:hypothetical protein
MPAFTATTPLYHMRLYHRSPQWHVTLKNITDDLLLVERLYILQPGESLTILFRAPPKFAELQFCVSPNMRKQISRVLFKFFGVPERHSLCRALDGTITLKSGTTTYGLSPVPAAPLPPAPAAPLPPAMEDAIQKQMVLFEAAVRRQILANMATGTT